MSSRLIMGRLLALSEYERAKTLFVFVSTPNEIDTIPVIKKALERGKRVGAPRCMSKGVMDVFEIKSLDDLEPGGQLGIREPGIHCPPILKSEIDFAVIPCICCDRRGYRIGYGGGYYDRYLADRYFPAAALCRNVVLRRELPIEPWDIPADIVLTETELYRPLKTNLS